MISTIQNLLTVTLVSTLISFTMVANAAGTGSGSIVRTKCATVEQEIIDFETLEKEIRKTNAIGALAKLKLSGDINKLLAELKAYHAGDSSLTAEQLREQYDLLYMKIVSQVQDKDPGLHQQLCNAWDPIWAALQDENNLQKVSGLSAPEIGATVTITGLILAVINSAIPSANAEEAYAEEKLSHDEVIKRDLLVIVTAQGALCTAVTLFKKLSNHDYVATCESGDKYRVYVTEDGRVNMTTQDLPE